MKTTIALWAVVTTLVGSLPAQAALIRFCVKHTGSYSDINIGEDLWTVNALRPASGQYMEVWKGAQKLWSGNGTTAEGAPGQGCTAQINQVAPNGSYKIFLVSKGSVSGFPIEVRNNIGEPIDLVTVAAYPSINDNGALGTYPVDLIVPAGTSAYQIFNLYAVTAYALHRMPGLGAGSLYRIYLHPTKNGHNSGNQTIYIKSGSSSRKFGVLHEVGHRTGYLSTDPVGGMNVEQNYDWYDPLCPRDVPVGSSCDGPQPLGPFDSLENGTGPGVCIGACLLAGCSPLHGMRSMEYVGSALGEGFANFFAAAVWNEQSGDANCFYRDTIPVGGTLTVDCEAAAPNFPLSYMRSTCSNPDETMGVELDWMRALWDMRTNYNPFGSPPSFIEMLTWIYNAPNWQEDTAYLALDGQADLESFRLNYAWDHTKAFGTADGNGL
jgi:hypothetical protein